MRITLVFFGSTGACAVYSYQMAEALSKRNDCVLQLIISKRVYNIDDWLKLSSPNKVEVYVFDTYTHKPVSFFFSLFRIKRFYRIIKTVFSFCCDVVYFPFGCTWAPILFPILSRRKILVNTIHDVHPHDNSRSVFDYLLTKSQEWSARYAHSIILLNHKDVEYIENKYKVNTSVIPHAAFTYYDRQFTDDAQNSIKHQICFVGRIEPYKGLILLVQAFKRIRTKGLSLVIAGSGHIDESLLTQIEEDCRIQLINRFISDTEMMGIIHGSDFVVLPYVRASQSGVIPLAFALGRTVVATRVGALDEQVPTETGLLVNPSIQDIANAIDFMYDDPTRINQYCRRAKQYAMEELSWDHSADLLVTFFYSLLNNQR